MIGKHGVCPHFLTRRGFLSLAAAFALPAASNRDTIHTVRGPIRTSKLDFTLMHEHVLVDFIGAAQVTKDRYNPDEVFRVALPHLKRIYELGCRTLVECTPAYLGRDPQLLNRLSTASRLHIVTNTGYYGAANDKYVPEHAYRESAEQLARRWIEEFKSGIDGTSIRPGFIKIGVDRGPLSEIDIKLVRAAALTHRATGLTIASHTGDGPAALEQIDILKREGVAASAFIWVHAHNETQVERHIRAAEQGAWLEFDGIREASLEKHVTFVKNLIDRGFLDRLLISQDAGWYRVGEPGGGNFRGYDLLFTRFIPDLKKARVSSSQIHRLLVTNPSRALENNVRTLLPLVKN